MTDSSGKVRLIKKYPNRRLYDTHTSAHVTLADIRQLVMDDIAFQVVDAKTGEDLTRSILLQVIQEAEGAGEPMFSSDMLRNIIRFYGPYQSVMGSCMEKSIQTLMDVQKQTGAQSAKAWNDFMETQVPVMQNLMGQYLEQSKQLYMNTQNLFGIFPGFPGAPGRKRPDDEDDKR